MNFMNTYIFSVDSNGQTYKHCSTDKKLHIGQRTGDPYSNRLASSVLQNSQPRSYMAKTQHFPVFPRGNIYAHCKLERGCTLNKYTQV